MIQKFSISTETKYSTMSLLSVLAVLLMHSAHWFSLPLMLGALEMQDHHHSRDMASTASGTVNISSLFFFLLNGAGIFYALLLLRTAWTTRHTSRLCYFYSAVSVVSLTLGVISFFQLT